MGSIESDGDLTFEESELREPTLETRIRMQEYIERYRQQRRGETARCPVCGYREDRYRWGAFPLVDGEEWLIVTCCPNCGELE